MTAPEDAEPQRMSTRTTLIDRLRDFALLNNHLRQVTANTLGVTVSDLSALSYLYAQGDLGQNELAQCLGLTPSATTSLIDRLERFGMALRCAHPHDRRRSIVSLTDAGRERVLALRRVYEAALGAVPEQDLGATVRVLDQLTAYLRGQLAR